MSKLEYNLFDGDSNGSLDSFKREIIADVRKRLPNKFGIKDLQMLDFTDLFVLNTDNLTLENIKKSRRAKADFEYLAFKYMLVEAITNQITVPTTQANTIFEKAWETGHSGGFNEVLSEAEELTDFVEAFLKLK